MESFPSGTTEGARSWVYLVYSVCAHNWLAPVRPVVVVRATKDSADSRVFVSLMLSKAELKEFQARTRSRLIVLMEHRGIKERFKFRFSLKINFASLTRFISFCVQPMLPAEILFFCVCCDTELNVAAYLLPSGEEEEDNTLASPDTLLPTPRDENTTPPNSSPDISHEHHERPIGPSLKDPQQKLARLCCEVATSLSDGAPPNTSAAALA